MAATTPAAGGATKGSTDGIVILRAAALAFLPAFLSLGPGGAACAPADLRGGGGAASVAGGADVRDFGAIGDGVADDTDAIQRAVRSGIGGVRLPRGVYRITRPIVVDLDRSGVTSIAGDGTARIVMEGPGPALRISGTHEGTASPATVKPAVWERQRMPIVEGLEIAGAHDQAGGVEARGTMELTVTRVAIRRALHGIHLVGRNRNVIISDCHIYDNRGAGVFYDHVNLHQSNITGSHISYNRGGGIVVRGGDVRNLQVGSCDIEGNMSESGPAANVLLDATAGSIGEVAIVGCTIQHDHDAPDAANIRVRGESTGVPYTGETRHGNITIADNVLSDVEINVDLEKTRGVTVSGNTMWKGYRHDLRVSGSSNIVIAGNVFDRNPRYHYGDGKDARGGIVLEKTTDSTLIGNHLLGTGEVPAAIFLRECRRVNIAASTVLDARHVGIRFEDVMDSRISDCLIRNDRRDGPDAERDASRSAPVSIEVAGGSGNQISDNLLGSRPSIDAGAGHAEGNLHP